MFNIRKFPDQLMTARFKAVTCFCAFAFSLFLTGLADIPGSVLRGYGFSAVQLTVLRTATVSVFFLALFSGRALLYGMPRITLSQSKTIIAFAVFGVVCANGGTTLSVSLAPDYVAIPVIFATSIATSLMMAIRRRDLVDRLDLGAAIFLVGLVALLIFDGAKSAGEFDPTVLWVPIVTGVAQGIAYHAVGGGEDIDPFTFYFLSFGIGGALMASGAASFGILDLATVGHINFPAEAWFYLAVLAGLNTVIPYLLMRASGARLAMSAKGSAGAAEPIGGVSSDAFQGSTPETTGLLIVTTIIAVVVWNQLRGRGSKGSSS